MDFLLPTIRAARLKKKRKRLHYKRDVLEIRRNGELVNTTSENGGKKKKGLEYIPAEIQKKINERLLKFQMRKFVAKGSSVKLVCDMTDEKAIRAAVVNMTVQWVFNNKPLKIDNKRIITHGESGFEILKFRTTDSGLYTCQVVIGKSYKKTVFFASIVTRKKGIPKTVQEQGMLKLWCPSSPLGRMFLNVYRDWTLDGDFIYRDVPAALRQEELINNVSLHHAGRYTCSAVDKTFQRTWILIRYQVKVLPLPPPQSPFIEFVKSHPICALTQSMNVVIFLFVLYIIFIHRAGTNKELKDTWKKKKVEIKKSEDDLGNFESVPQDDIVDLDVS